MHAMKDSQVMMEMICILFLLASMRLNVCAFLVRHHIPRNILTCSTFYNDIHSLESNIIEITSASRNEILSIDLHCNKRPARVVMKASRRNKIAKVNNDKSNQSEKHDDKEDSAIISSSDERDTIRVRIWRALAEQKGLEVSLKQLGSIVGERNMGDLRSHLTHVERQAKTFGNKSPEWKERRGIDVNVSKVKLKTRKGDKGMLQVRLLI